MRSKTRHICTESGLNSPIKIRNNQAENNSKTVHVLHLFSRKIKLLLLLGKVKEY